MRWYYHASWQDSASDLGSIRGVGQRKPLNSQMTYDNYNTFLIFIIINAVADSSLCEGVNTMPAGRIGCSDYIGLLA